MKRDRLSVVHEDNVEEFLARLGLLEDMVAGKLACQYCSKPLTLENFLAVAPRKRETVLACNTPVCYHAFLSEFFSGPA